MKQKKLLIVDGHALLHRAFHALPQLTTKNGQLVNAVYGFFLIFLNALKEQKPDYIAVCFDRAEPTFRHNKFKEYKAHRPKTPNELKSQLPIVKEGLKKFNVPIIERAGFEADDLIASLAKKTNLEHPDILVLILTGDLDTLQFINDKTNVITLRKGLTDSAIYDKKAVEQRFGFPPAYVADFKGLRGDPSDNIPGIKGIGEKTAKELIISYGHIEDIYRALDKGVLKTSERIINLLSAQKDEAILSKDLAKARDDLEIDYILADFITREFSYDEAFDFLKQMEFKSLLSKIPRFTSQGGLFEKTALKKEKKFVHIIIKKDNFPLFVKELAKQTKFVFDTETVNLGGELVGISFCFSKDKAYYLPLSDHLDFKIWDKKEEILKKLKPIFINSKIKKIAHNFKYDYKILKRQNINAEGVYFDTMVASWLLDPETRSHSLERLAFVELGYEKINKDEIFSKKNQFDLRQTKLEQVAQYSAEDALVTFRLYDLFLSRLKKSKLWELFLKVEMPLIKVLAQMEENGIRIDKGLLAKFSREATDELREIEKKVRQIVGFDFNLNSPVQLREVFFTKLKIDSSNIKKTKTGLSTAASELEKMKGKHKIIDLILRHRELSKLKNTYLDALPRLADKNSLVHTSFNQTTTATGRLSSSDPNLQNIPTRTLLGKRIRKAFLPRFGNELIVADYSQIELRVIAHLAKEDNMIKAFLADEDIHKATAALIYDLPLDKVSAKMRSRAKTVNFGVIYGISPFGLAKTLGVSLEYARGFIEKYFLLFPKLENYTQKIIHEAREKGYAETLFGRRRYLKAISSQLPDQRSAAERAAVNMPVQGTAADLVKMAMIKINSQIKQKFPHLLMLLQVHDELVFEIEKKQAKKASFWIKQEMEKIIKISVPLRVDIGIVDSWGEVDK